MLVKSEMWASRLSRRKLRRTVMEFRVENMREGLDKRGFFDFLEVPIAIGAGDFLSRLAVRTISEQRRYGEHKVYCYFFKRICNDNNITTSFCKSLIVTIAACSAETRCCPLLHPEKFRKTPISQTWRFTTHLRKAASECTWVDGREYKYGFRRTKREICSALWSSAAASNTYSDSKWPRGAQQQHSTEHMVCKLRALDPPTTCQGALWIHYHEEWNWDYEDSIDVVGGLLLLLRMTSSDALLNHRLYS